MAEIYLDAAVIVDDAFWGQVCPICGQVVECGPATECTDYSFVGYPIYDARGKNADREDYDGPIYMRGYARILSAEEIEFLGEDEGALHRVEDLRMQKFAERKRSGPLFGRLLSHVEAV